ncbi:MAG: DinB family protein [Candidatus Electryonea clarkiae]|nr:DinB family protein [Candidatus Electryonea clarkiae]MDP8286928.1 DinB family protein [Candidatus Electryonea clarkiae]
MITKEFLIDFHQRVHRSFKLLLTHCHNLTIDELNQELDGFGYPTIRLQLHHMIGAEKYWIGVLQGRIDVDEDDHLYTTIESLESYRDDVFKATEEYLKSSSEDELETSRPMMTWGNKEKILNPTQVLLRTQTHIFHHQGQILAMCRLFGKPCNGLDYPID